MNKKIFTVLFLLLAMLSGVNASELPDSLVLQGNQAYNDGRYQQAVDAYQAVIKQGLESSELYYNLGNAYFKLNDIPSAILFYNKALKLNPKDEDINFNLNLANSRIIDKIEPVPEFFLKKWVKQLVNLMSPDHWARLGIILFILMLFFGALFLVSRRITLRKLSFWSASMLLVLALLVFVIGFQAYSSMKQEREGIIFTPTVTVKSSPSENSVDLFVIHEGTRVNILDNLEGWTEIKIANGSVGWISSSDYRPI